MCSRAKYTQSIRNARAVVHGHVTLTKMAQLGGVYYKLGNVYHIDTGGWLMSGTFTLLDCRH